MTQDKLNYLLVLAGEQNVTRAARRLYITQPTLTGFLNRLEQDLGFRIFDRQSSPVTLTASGKHYIDGMQKLLREEHELKEKLRCEAQSRIQFRIGIGQVHSQMLSPILAEKLIEQHPGLNLQFCESKESILLDMLRRGEIDLFVGHAQIGSTVYLSGELSTERLSLYMPDSFLNLSAEERSQNSPENLESGNCSSDGCAWIRVSVQRRLTDPQCVSVDVPDRAGTAAPSLLLGSRASGYPQMLLCLLSAKPQSFSDP